MGVFDEVAAEFDQHRAFPSEVPRAVRAAVMATVGQGRSIRVLDVGAGTGRMGASFVEEGDDYIGIDASAPMLRQFLARMACAERAPRLVQADGQSLPFADASFHAVLLAHVLSGSARWRGILEDARRVLRPDGVLVLGQAAGPPSGVDARMRQQLSVLTESIAGESRPPRAHRENARSSLAASCRHKVQLTAARWESVRTPREFLDRQRTGARFARLPPETRERLLRELSDWAVGTFGSLDTCTTEPFALVLDFYWF
jgi:ubiquinone/menaquinone biosynthesis C-methylase UbiE